MLERLVAGDVAKKHHVALRGAGDALRYEECITRDGFDGPYTIVYHERRPHTAKHVEPAGHGWAPPSDSGGPELLRRHYKTFELPSTDGAPIDCRTPLLFNDDVTVSTLRPTTADPMYFANGDGDDLVYVHEGGGVLRSQLGDVRFEANDYVCIPRSLIHRFIPDEGVAQYWLVIECAGGVGLLEQWRNELGQLKMDAPYCHRDFRHPVFEGPRDEGIRDVVVKKRHGFHRYSYDDSPLDVVGWDGTVYPWAFPILNFQPRAGLVHLPPTWHGTFSARGALICSFVPRMLDFHPDAIPCPYPHSSVDVDELIFYCRGNFTSRRGIAPGSVSYHPAGVPHGPHPGAYENSIGAQRTDELAVMLDCYLPLHATSAARGVEDDGYHDSFR